MATAVPALRGNFGSFEYFLTTMHVGELVKSITIPHDMDDWESLSLEERYQRDINVNRVRREIAPYFAGDENRFSSALILAVKNDEGMNFEPLDQVLDFKRVPGLYQAAGQNIGFLIREGGEVLVPLDGQHRAKAFKFAIDGQDDKGRAIVDGKGKEISDTTLAADEVAVILVRFDREGSRRIFNKVNQYAKPTGRGQNLITADDDAIAVISRRVISDDGLIPAELVRWESNTLSAKAPEFTTLATLADANEAIITAGCSPAGKLKDADEAQQELYYREVVDVWNDLLTKIEWFAEALADPSSTGTARRVEIRSECLLGKPIGQLALVRGFLLLRDKSPGVSVGEICNRLNRIDWTIGAKHWEGVLVNRNGRVMSGKTTVNFAAQFIAYLAGAELTDDERATLANHIAGDDESYDLPKPAA